MARVAQHGGSSETVCVAIAVFVVTVVVFATMAPEYSHVQQPVAMLGSAGTGHALWFNLLAFILPGLSMAWVATRLRGELDGAGWLARIGARLLAISALAFAAQGVLPLQPELLDAAVNRLHAVAWTLWWVAFVPGAVLMVSRYARRAGGQGLALASLVAPVLLVVLALLLPGQLLPVGVAQRAAVGVWMGYMLLVAWPPARGPGR